MVVPRNGKKDAFNLIVDTANKLFQENDRRDEKLTRWMDKKRHAFKLVLKQINPTYNQTSTSIPLHII